MFSMITHILTIAALMWHVAMGCCGHFPHGSADSNSLATIHPVNKLVAVPKSLPSNFSHCRCGSHTVRQVADVKSKDVGQLKLIDENNHDSNAPCDRSGGCAHGRCLFLGSGAEIELIHPVDAMRVDVSAELVIYTCPSYRLAMSANQCLVHCISCDLLQSWQI